MAALTPTKVLKSELAGDQKLYICTVVPTSASDTITFVAATHKFRKIYGAFPFLEAGIDAALLTAHATFSGLVVTLVTKGADGLAATDWTDAVVRLLLVVGSAD
jgi:hypothetical protein